MILTFICRLLKIGMRRLLLADSTGNCLIIRKWQVKSGTTYTKTPKEQTPSILQYKPKPLAKLSPLTSRTARGHTGQTVCSDANLDGSSSCPNSGING